MELIGDDVRENLDWGEFKNRKLGEDDPPHQIRPKLDQDAWENSQVWQNKRKELNLLDIRRETQKKRISTNLGG